MALSSNGSSHSSNDNKYYLKALQQWRQEQFEKTLERAQKMVGPNWYQVLSTDQLEALYSLKASINQDVLEDRPKRVRQIINKLGITPMPSDRVLMNSIILGQLDPLGFLAELFRECYGHTVDCKREEYVMNAKLLMTAVFCTGFDDLVQMLEEMFYVEPEPEPPAPKKKIKKPPKSDSPYGDDIIVKPAQVEKPKPKPRPLPLPDLDALMNLEATEEIPVIKEPPKLKPPRIPKPRLNTAECDKVGEYTDYSKKPEPEPVQEVVVAVTEKKKKSYPRRGPSDVQSKNSEGTSKKKKFKKAGPPPDPPYANCILHHGGVTKCNGEMVYQVYGVVIQPTNCVLLHMGIVMFQGKPINFYGGYIAYSEDAQAQPCDCMKWFDTVVEYMHKHKCRCDHFYEFDHSSSDEERIREKLARRKPGEDFYKAETHVGHWFDEPTIVDVTSDINKRKKLGIRQKGAPGVGAQGEAPQTGEDRTKTDELVAQDKYFVPPSRDAPAYFDENKIFEMDTKKLFIQRAVEDVLNTDSIIGIPKLIKQRKIKKVRSKCLSENPTPKEYLQCALRLLKPKNVAATLPDAHLVPELLEWMRFRIEGPLNAKDKDKQRNTMKHMWEFFHNLNIKHWGHIGDPKMPVEKGEASSWKETGNLRVKFDENVTSYKADLYKMFADQQNLMWPTMYQHREPDKTFRKVFFAYMPQTQRDIFLHRPFDLQEAMARRKLIQSRPYRC